MRIRTVGRSGLRVSDLWLGAMTFGMPEWGCDERESLALIDRYYFNERAFGIVDVLVAAAREAGCTPAQLALAWQLEKPEITSVIIGARNLAQLEDNLGATAVHVSPEIMTRLEDATRIEPEYPGVFIA